MNDSRALCRSALLDCMLNAEQQAYFKLHHADVSRDACVIGSLPLIYNPYAGTLAVGKHVIFNSSAETSFANIGSPVKLALGRNASIQIGDYCDLNGCVLTAYEMITIGSFVQIGPGTWITDTDLHSLDPNVRRRQMLGEPYDWSTVSRKPVVIEDDVWIGSSSIILKGVTIGRAAVIGAGSVVTKDVPAGCVVAGNPARIIRRLS